MANNCKWCDKGIKKKSLKAWDFQYHNTGSKYFLCRDSLPKDVGIKQKEVLENVEMEGHLPFMLDDILDELNKYEKTNPGSLPYLKIFKDSSGYIMVADKKLCTFSYYQHIKDLARLEIIKGINE